jgi:hypothetical protein
VLLLLAPLLLRHRLQQVLDWLLLLQLTVSSHVRGLIVSSLAGGCQLLLHVGLFVIIIGTIIAVLSGCHYRPVTLLARLSCAIKQSAWLGFQRLPGVA